jgi:hypothetical protein
MKSRPAIVRSPMPIMKKPEHIGHELKGRGTDAIGLPVNVNTAARPMFRGENWEPFFQERTIEGRVVSHH